MIYNHLFQGLKAKGQNIPPRDVANQLLGQLKNQEPYIEKVYPCNVLKSY